MIGRKWIIAVFVTIGLTGADAIATGIKIARLGNGVQPQVQILEWGRRQQGKQLEWLKSTSIKSLPPADYGLRLAGTDYVFGPLRVAKQKTVVFELAQISVTAPEGSGPAVFFLIDSKTGSMAARIPCGGGPVPILPGEFKLTRDLSNVSSAVTVASGQHLKVHAGSVTIAAPQGVADCELYLSTQDQSVAAFFRLSQGDQVVFPGTYRVIKKDSGAFSREIVVVASQRTVLSCAGVSVSSMDQRREPYLVLRKSDLAPIVSGICDGNTHLIFPGSYLIMTKRYAADAISKEDTELLRSAVSFVADKADHVPLWRTHGDGFFTGNNSQIPVGIEGKHKWLAVGRTYRATVDVAETCTVSLLIRDFQTGKQLHEISDFAAKPPRTGVSFRLPPEIADGAAIVLTAKATVGSGADFVGSSTPRRAVHCHAGKIPKVAVGKTTDTTIELTWQQADGSEVAGYNVYRVPAGDWPINGKTPLTKTAFKDIGLSASRKYDYQVRAVDPRGVEGPASRVLSTTTTTTTMQSP